MKGLVRKRKLESFWYEEWLEIGNREVLDDIINYNEDDVRASEHLYLWLPHRGRSF